jgi:acetyl esterase/lipase
MSVTKTHNPVVLEPASQTLVEATAKPPFLYEMSPAEARAVLDDVQAAPIDKLPVSDRWMTVPADVGDVRVRIVRPVDAVGTLPVILYMHGGGWVLGNADTHDRLVRELGVGTGAAVVFVEYDREQFAEGYFLTAKMMEWFWDAYEPDAERRLEPFASPFRAGDEQLAGLPPALVIVGEADVLRDEGEAYAARLRAAGTAVTTVRYDGITHDFLMLNPLSDTHATRAAIAQATAVLRAPSIFATR